MACYIVTMGVPCLIRYTWLSLCECVRRNQLFPRTMQNDTQPTLIYCHDGIVSKCNTGWDM